MGDNHEHDDVAAGTTGGRQDAGSSDAARGADDPRTGPDSTGPGAAGGGTGTGADVDAVDAEAGMRREVGDIDVDDPDDGSLPGRMGGGLAGG